MEQEKKSNITLEEKLFAFLAIFFSIFGFIIALILKRNNDYVMFYAKQSLILFLIQIISGIVSFILFSAFGAAILNLGLSILWFIGIAILNLGLSILWFIGIIYALSGEKKNIPLIGYVAVNLFERRT